MTNNATKNISKKFSNLYEKAKGKRLLTNNMSKKFVKELENLINARNSLLNLKRRRG
jgi:hypothetical protein